MKPEISILPDTWDIPEAIRNRIGREAGPQRAMLEEGHLLIILHQLPEPDQHTRKAALFWREPEGEWSCNSHGVALTGLQDLLQLYEGKLDELEKSENKAATATEYHRVLEVLAPVLRSSRGLHRALQQAREMLATDRELINFRDQAASVERTSELLLQDAQFGLNFIAAKQAETQAANAQKMAATGYRLNLLAALFLPLTALVSVFGMEIRSGIPDTPLNFKLICTVGIVMGLIICFILRKDIERK